MKCNHDSVVPELSNWEDPKIGQECTNNESQETEVKKGLLVSLPSYVSMRYVH